MELPGGMTILMRFGIPPLPVLPPDATDANPAAIPWAVKVEDPPVCASKALAVLAGRRRHSFRFPPTIRGTMVTFELLLLWEFDPPAASLALAVNSDWIMLDKTSLADEDVA